MICTLVKYNKNDKVKENEMGRSCSMNGEENLWGFGGKARRKETTRKT
jgi:hypothetical protein